jgi:NAD(P)-dependent dehydrogenase (short-subunit alcohol dehydrogenase family)
VPDELRQIDILGTFYSIFISNPLNNSLVNNAGFVKGVEKVGEIADQDIDDMIATNVRNSILLKAYILL